jgi:protein-tyrosine phosphatase
MIDIHCHVLPDVDDGARSWDIALKMCAMAWEDGIEHIVATPHADNEYFYDRPYFEQILHKLSQATGAKPALSLGCDFHFSFDNIKEVLVKPGKFTIGKTPYLLVEFSDFSIPPTTEENLVKLMKNGLRPIITHPERNLILQRTPERVLDWVRLGCAVQVTANALTGRWGKKAEATAHLLFEREAVHILASDAHGLDSRPPILSVAREQARKIAGDLVADMLVTENPRAVINGEQLPYFPKISS